MNLMTKTAMSGAALIALVACEGPVGQVWHMEAGAFLDEGGFGNPTMQNMMAQMCAGQAKGYIVPDPIVVQGAKGSGSSAPRRGYVMCSGHMNGKYAQVVFDSYITSAQPTSELGGGLAAIESSGGE
ncbi:MAG: hypothetical protein OIF48_11640 [Silicimonas sp.]|nr:hypothetical protein [Silicimonas sp.]